MMKMSIDIIIINYNSTDYTLRCIKSARLVMGERVNFIVVDNNSTDEPDRILKQNPDIHFIKNSINLGFGNAINHALDSTSSQYIMLLNPDAIVLDFSLDEILNYLEEHPEVAIAGPMILEPDGSVQGSARRFPTVWTSIFGRKSPLTRLFPRNPITKKEFICFNGGTEKPQTVDWVSGACMIIRRKAIMQVGGFDSQFFMYWEDADLCKRLKEKGWKTVYFPKSKICHYTGKSSDTRQVSSIYQFHKSCFTYFKKHTKLPVNLFAPFILFGLSLRCLFVLGLNRFQQLLTKGKRVDYIKYRNKKSSKKLKVLRIVSRLNIGGPSIHCAILTKGLNPERFATKLLTGTISPHEGDMSYLIKDTNGHLLKVPELQREITLIKDIKAFIRILQIIFREKPDIVHTHMAKAGAISRAAVFIYNLMSPQKPIRCVHTYHGHVLQGYFSPFISSIFIGIEKMLAKITDAIIAISQTQKWELTQKYKLADPGKVHVINLGFNLTRLIDLKGKGTLRTNIGIDSKVILIGIIGRLTPIKNHHLFLDSAKMVIERFPDKSILFVIVGDGELRKNLENYAVEINVAKRVIFYGWEKKIENVYADLDMLVLSSNNEGTPVSIIESMAASVPVVTTGVGGVKDLLGRIETRPDEKKKCSICERGILCPKDDPVSLSDAISFSIENDNGKRTAKAKDFVLSTYTDKLLIQKLEKLYSGLIQQIQ